MQNETTTSSDKAKDAGTLPASGIGEAVPLKTVPQFVAGNSEHTTPVDSEQHTIAGSETDAPKSIPAKTVQQQQDQTFPQQDMAPNNIQGSTKETSDSFTPETQMFALDRAPNMEESSESIIETQSPARDNGANVERSTQETSESQIESLASAIENDQNVVPQQPSVSHTETQASALEQDKNMEGTAPEANGSQTEIQTHYVLNIKKFIDEQSEHTSIKKIEEFFEKTPLDLPLHIHWSPQLSIECFKKVSLGLMKRSQLVQEKQEGIVMEEYSDCDVSRADWIIGLIGEDSDWNKFPTKDWKTFFESFVNPPVIRICDNGLSAQVIDKLLQYSGCFTFVYQCLNPTPTQRRFRPAIDTILSTKKTNRVRTLSCKFDEVDEADGLVVYFLDTLADRPNKLKNLEIKLEDASGPYWGAFYDYIGETKALESLKVHLLGNQEQQVGKFMAGVTSLKFLKAIRINESLKNFELYTNMEVRDMQHLAGFDKKVLHKIMSKVLRRSRAAEDKQQESPGETSDKPGEDGNGGSKEKSSTKLLSRKGIPKSSVEEETSESKDKTREARKRKGRDYSKGKSTTSKKKKTEARRNVSVQRTAEVEEKKASHGSIARQLETSILSRHTTRNSRKSPEPANIQVNSTRNEPASPPESAKNQRSSPRNELTPSPELTKNQRSSPRNKPVSSPRSVKKQQNTASIQPAAFTVKKTPEAVPVPSPFPKNMLVSEGPPDEEIPGGWPKGWIRRIYARPKGTKSVDKYWFPPGEDHRKLRSMKEVERYFAALEKSKGDREFAWNNRGGSKR